MLLTPKTTLSEKILFVLGKHPNSTAEFILKVVGPSNYSIQAVYKELRTMQKFGAVVKVGHSFSLRVSYVLALSEMFDAFQTISLSSGLSSDILSGPSKQVWRLNSLIKVVNFWDYLLVGLVSVSKSKQLFGYTKHAWYHLAQPEAEDRYLQAIRRVGGKIFLTLGSKRPLDVWSEKFWPKDVVEFGYGKSFLESDEDLEFDVIDDYIVTVKKDKKVSQIVEGVYSSVAHPRDFSGLAEIFLRPASVKVVLEKNPKKAMVLRKKFTRFFGLRVSY